MQEENQNDIFSSTISSSDENIVEKDSVGKVGGKKAKLVKEVKEDESKIYEIGYLLVSSIPEEKVASEVATLKEILSKKGAEFIGEGIPELRPLAYTMVKKIGALNHKFTQGYFGWFKFEILKKEIESIKKAFDENQSVLRILIITTIRENTFLGKKAPIASIAIKEEEIIVHENVISEEIPIVPITPATIEEMDKSIDEMVKEV